MKRLHLAVLAAVVVGASMTALTLRAPSGNDATASPAATAAPDAVRVPPAPLYGATLDNDSGAGNAKVAAQRASLDALPHMPTTRIVFDPGTKPANYEKAITALRPVSYIVGELEDSSALRRTSLTQYQAKARAFVDRFGADVDIYEVGNEVNGNWTGDYPTVATKIYDAWAIVHDARLPSMLTLWYNPGCKGSARELDPLAFSRQYVPLAMRNGLDYVTVSYYETQCNNYRPSPAVLTSFFTQLHGLYPNARLGFGEIGIPNRVTSKTLSRAQSIALYYYGLDLNLSYYVGWYAWWYFAEDAVPASKPMWATLAEAMQ